MMQIAPRTLFIPHNGMAKMPPPNVSRMGICPVAVIQETVASSYGISPRLMRAAARDRYAAWPRQVAMYLAREITHHSLPTIGRLFGNRDHSTVCHAIKSVERRMAADPAYRGNVEALRGTLAA